MLKQIATWGLLFASITASSQTESSAFTASGRGVATTFVTDYHALGINPANLGWQSQYEGKTVTFGMFEIAGSFFSEAFNKNDLRKNLFFGEFDDLTQEERDQAAEDFVKARNTADLNIMGMGIAVQTGIGTFAFSSGDNITWKSKFGEDLTDIVFYGFQSSYFDSLVLTTGAVIPNTGNYGQDTLDLIVSGTVNPENQKSLAALLNGSDIETSWVREYRFGYGTKVYSNDRYQFFAGAGVKYLQGMHIISFSSDGNSAGGFASVSPFYDLDFDEAETNPSANLENSGTLPEPVGQGFGFDLGVSAIIDERLTLGLSMNNIGSMTWDGNVYKLEDILVDDYENPGVSSLSIVDQLNSIIGSDGAIEWNGEETLKTKLAKNLRIGASYKFGEKLNAGLDVVMPMDEEVGALEKPLIGLGGDFIPVKWFRFSMGFLSGGNYDFKIPAGIVFVAGNGTWECGFSSRDIITFFSENDPTISLSTGFLRFRF
jgi:hypothetical protein